MSSRTSSLRLRQHPLRYAAGGTSPSSPRTKQKVSSDGQRRTSTSSRANRSTLSEPYYCDNSSHHDIGSVPTRSIGTQCGDCESYRPPPASSSASRCHLGSFTSGHDERSSSRFRSTSAAAAASDLGKVTNATMETGFVSSFERSCRLDPASSPSLRVRSSSSCGVRPPVLRGSGAVASCGTRYADSLNPVYGKLNAFMHEFEAFARTRNELHEVMTELTKAKRAILRYLLVLDGPTQEKLMLTIQGSELERRLAEPTAKVCYLASNRHEVASTTAVEATDSISGWIIASHALFLLAVVLLMWDVPRQ